MPDIGKDPVQQSILAAFRCSYFDGLVATRDYIATQLDAGVPPRDAAALTKRIADVSKEIEDLEHQQGKQGVVNVSDAAFRAEAI